MESVPIIRGIVRLREDANKKRFAVKCLRCGESAVKLEFSEVEPVVFNCGICEVAVSIDEVTTEISEWVNVLAWIAAYKAVGPDLKRFTE